MTSFLPDLGQSKITGSGNGLCNVGLWMIGDSRIKYLNIIKGIFN